MKNLSSKAVTLGVTVALTTTALLGAPPALAAEPGSGLPPALAPMTALYQTVACDPAGPTASDAALATQLNSRLNSDMRGYMTAYRVSCAREVVEAVRARGLASRAAVIAITTVIVETHLQNISEEVDHTSLGLFQQQEWWGTRAERLNPAYATNAFLNVMVRKYPNGSWANAPIGDVCQAVQVSAYPDRYQAQAPDAQIIVDSLWDYAGPRSEDVPISGDWNNDGIDTVGVFRPSNSTFYLRDTNSGDATRIFKFGHGPSGDIPVAGDWNNDGYDTVGVFRPTNSTWYLNGTTTTDHEFKFGHGPSGDQPVAGDWNNNGYDSVGVFRPSNSTWYLTNGTTTATNTTDHEYIFGHGPSGDIAIPGRWIKNSNTTPGVRRPSNNTVYLRNTNSGGPVDTQFIYGI